MREHRLRDALDAAGIGVYEWDLDSGSMLWDATLRSIWSVGAAESVDEALFLRGIHPEDRDAASRIIDAARSMLDQGRFQVEFRVVGRDDGLVHWVRATGQVFLETGRPKALVGTARDITQKKTTEEALQRQSALLEAMTDTMPAAIYVKDAGLKLIFVNPSAAQLMRRVPEDLLGRTSAEAFPDRSEAQSIDENDRMVMHNGFTLSFEEAVRGEQGIRYYISTKSPLRDARGQVTGIVGVSHDVTESKLATRALQGHADRQAMLLELSGQLVAASDNDEATLIEAIVRRLGPPLDIDICFNYRLVEADGSLELVASVGIPAEHARDARRLGLNQAFCGLTAATRRPVLADAQRIARDPLGAFVRRMGVRSYASHPLLARNGQLLGTLSFASTRRERFDPDEVEFLQTVCHLVELSWERMRYERAMRVADRQKDLFLAMLAHELRNPLAPIRNASSLLMRRIAPDSELAPLPAMIDRQTHQLSRLVDDLLDISRIAQGRIQLHEETLPVRAVVEQAVETVEPLIVEKRHRLELKFPEAEVHVRGDRARLVQALGNVLHNAAKYTDAGGRISLEVSAIADDVRIVVHDDGPGIAAALLPHVFDLFVQSERTLDRAQGGLGIGLSLVKRLVEMHGGVVSASSEGAGTGATFTLRLPRVAGPAAMPAPAVAAAGRPRRILVVDDNVDAADSLAMLLRLDGHEVDTAYGAEGALAAVAARPPEIMLLDIGLPMMDGYEVARRARALPEGAGVRFIALTGYGQGEDRELALAAGFEHHLVKPPDLETLQRLLQS